MWLSGVGKIGGRDKGGIECVFWGVRVVGRYIVSVGGGCEFSGVERSGCGEFHFCGDDSCKVSLSCEFERCRVS